MLKVIIAGTRTFNDEDMMAGVMENRLLLHDISNGIEIVSGGAPGADLLGEKYARENGYDIKQFPAKWKDLDVPGAVIRSGPYGPYNAIAGHQRNAEMAKYCDIAIVFRINRSNGSTDMINRMKKIKKPVYVVDIEY